MEWKNSFPPSTPIEIERFEKNTSVKLPAIYRGFLLESHGGSPVNYHYFEIRPLNQRVLISGFFGIGEKGDSRDLETNCKHYRDTVLDGYIPIGRDPGGNLLLLMTMGPDTEKIFSWDRFDILTTPDGQNTFLVANNMNEFLENLRPVLD